MGAESQPNSGATPWAKEDLKDGVFLYQHKELEEGTKGHRVTVKDLEELRCNAVDDYREPCYVIEYPGAKWFMIDEDNFLRYKRWFEEQIG